MCTLTIIRARVGALRVVMNRDESDARAPALPPRWRTLTSGARAIWPTDPQSGGTWIGATTRGLVLAMMNSSAGVTRRGEMSRGAIIPECADALHVRDAADRVGAMPLKKYASFRMMACDARDGRGVVLAWDGSTLRESELRAPACLASSGLGDELVQDRVARFESELAQTCADHPELHQLQDRFHEHVWPDRPHLSVLMSRPGYRTVSITCVRLDPEDDGGWRVSMSMRPVERAQSVASRTSQCNAGSASLG